MDETKGNLSVITKVWVGLSIAVNLLLVFTKSSDVFGGSENGLEVLVDMEIITGTQKIFYTIWYLMLIASVVFLILLFLKKKIGFFGYLGATVVKIIFAFMTGSYSLLGVSEPLIPMLLVILSIVGLILTFLFIKVLNSGSDFESLA